MTKLLVSLQVEFGAHQVILVRDLTAVAKLPEELRNDSALIMTVSQVRHWTDCLAAEHAT